MIWETWGWKALFFFRLHSACSEGGLAEKSGRFSGLHGLRRNTRRERTYHQWTSFWKAPVGKCQEHGGFVQAEKWDTWPEKIMVKPLKVDGLHGFKWDDVVQVHHFGEEATNQRCWRSLFLWDLVRCFFLSMYRRHMIGGMLGIDHGAFLVWISLHTKWDVDGHPEFYDWLVVWICLFSSVVSLNFQSYQSQSSVGDGS